MSFDALMQAAVAGDAAGLAAVLTADPGLVNREGGPKDWDALTYLCFGEHPNAAAAEVLLKAGANANTGYFEGAHQPSPCFESVLYAAAGIAHDAALTKLLMDYGADPNDAETPYHAPEGYDLGAMQAVVESGRCTAGSLAAMLLRKCDWHDDDGIRYLLEHGADPNRATQWGYNAFQQAVRRDNGMPIIELLLDSGADPGSILRLAARRGRADIFELFAKRGIPVVLDSAVDRLILDCVLDRVEDTGAREELLAIGSELIVVFAGNGNNKGIANLLRLGVPVDARYEGDGYWELKRDTTALHFAAWIARHETVKFLIERGADVNARDARGRSPLMLAVKACVDSYWTRRRKPDSIAMLLAAGASKDGLELPSGYDKADELLCPQ